MTTQDQTYRKFTPSFNPFLVPKRKFMGGFVPFTALGHDK